MKSNKLRSLIVAYGVGNYVIGDGKKMAKWRLPTDLQFFVDITMAAGICITGRKNYESLPKKFRPLPGRIMIIVTENPLWVPEEDDDNVFVVNSFWDALQLAETLHGKEICFIGGGQTYTWALENIILDKIHLTTVLSEVPFEGSVTFPGNLLPNLVTDYFKTYHKEVAKDETHSHYCLINSYERKQKREQPV